MFSEIVIAGGGAAGFFAAITCAENNPDAEVIILERGKKVLEKVKISGGGRCNLTHACFDPKEIINFYPRGSKALLGPFHQFCSGDTVDWFEKRGVKTKIESDGRMFPTTDDSQTIVDCLLENARAAGVKIIMQSRIEKITPPTLSNEKWQIEVGDKIIQADKLMIATGSNPKIWKLLKNLGHSIVKPVPSLFTFNIKDPRIEGLAGLAVKNVSIKIQNSKLQASGPLLITHWGMSGPGILKLSAWGARILNDWNYRFQVNINWLGEVKLETTIQNLQKLKKQISGKQVIANTQFQIPIRLWKRLISATGINDSVRWGDLSNKLINKIATQLTQSNFSVNGKSTFKEEFVTAGGVELKEVNFKRFESKIHKNLFFAGEVLNIDAVTGGFNFQAAWTGGWIAGNAMSEF
jgi:predicted Rossmann fold flavoprotein